MNARRAIVLIALGFVAIAGAMAIGACGSSSNSGNAGASGTTSSGGSGTTSTGDSGTTSTGDSGWTSEETSYLDGVGTDIDVMSESLSDFGDRVGNWPYSEDDTYALAADCATWQSTYDIYKDMPAPSDRFSTMHGLWVSGLGCYNDAADLFASGVDTADSSLVEAASAKMDEGMSYVSQANDELSRIQSE